MFASAACSDLVGHPVRRESRRHTGSRLVIAAGGDAGSKAAVADDAHSSAAAATGGAPLSVDAGSKEQQLGIPYDGVVLDMDGTLTVSNIDFEDLRQRTGIPEGDLFTVMEAWESEESIKQALDTILVCEEEACTTLSLQPGLLALLEYLRDSNVKVALVTRNTHASVDAFFNVLGESWRQVFDVVLTREHRYVKPDKSLLLELAQEWGVEPWKILMVGDSAEDVETGNAAGTATALIAGSGNEMSGTGQRRAGAVPSFAVAGLHELLERLRSGQVMLGWGSSSTGTLEMDDPYGPGAPPPGIDFVDWLFETGAVCRARCSFPRMGAAAGGALATSDISGDAVLHLNCGSGSLTKLMASQGLRVIGADADISAARQRGLTAFQLLPEECAVGEIKAETSCKLPLDDARFRSLDAVVLFDPGYGDAAGDIAQLWLLSQSGLAQIQRCLLVGGRLCAEVPAEHYGDDGFLTEQQLRTSLEQAGMKVEAMSTELDTFSLPRIRLVASRWLPDAVLGPSDDDARKLLFDVDNLLRSVLNTAELGDGSHRL